jgi:hypothetical protein
MTADVLDAEKAGVESGELSVAGDGTDDAIIFRGANCKAVGNDFTGQPVDSASLAIPNGAFINSVASADSVITDNTVGDTGNMVFVRR